VKPFDGDLDDYRRRVLSESGADTQPAGRPAPRPDPTAARRAAAEKRAETAPLRKRVTKAETDLANLTWQLNKLDAALADGELFARDPARAAALSKTRASVVDAIAKAEEEWLAASEALQTA
jgi:ATP-binding cassette subfamily F protein 3